MNIDKNLIRHWANLFESEEMRMNGGESFLEEDFRPKRDFDEAWRKVNPQIAAAKNKWTCVGYNSFERTKEAVVFLGVFDSLDQALKYAEDEMTCDYGRGTHKKEHCDSI